MSKRPASNTEFDPVQEAAERHLRQAATAHRKATAKAEGTRADLGTAIGQAKVAGLSFRAIAGIADISVGAVQDAIKGGSA